MPENQGIDGAETEKPGPDSSVDSSEGAIEQPVTDEAAGGFSANESTGETVADEVNGGEGGDATPAGDIDNGGNRVEKQDAADTAAGSVSGSGSAGETVAGSVYESSIDKQIGDETVSGSVYGEFPIANATGIYRARFVAKSGNGLLRLVYKGTSLQLSPLRASRVDASFEDNQITYGQIYPDTSLEYTAEANRLKEVLVLSGPGRTEFAFGIELRGATIEPPGRRQFAGPGPGRRTPLPAGGALCHRRRG